MKGNYDDIINLQYPFPTSRKRMSMTERGAQFSPFAALTGYDAAIRETERVTEKQIELDVDGKNMVDEFLRKCYRVQESEPEVTLHCFVPDSRKAGGATVLISGKIKKVDLYRGGFVLTDGTELAFSQIYKIDGDALRDCWIDENV